MRFKMIIAAKIYRDMLEIFDNEYFHMGGDEVKLDCWEEEPEITEYLLNQGKNNTKEALIDLWGEFQDKGTLLKLYAASGETIMNVNFTLFYSY